MFDFTNQYGINVNVNSKPVHEYPHTDGYTYIEGRNGSKYELELINNSSERVLMIPSVDGLSVINGKQEWNDGYVLNPNERVSIPGWRIDQTKVAAFEFADTRDSYTNRMGNGVSNTGVIGLMVFREKPQITNTFRGNFTYTNQSLNNTQIAASSAGDWIVGQNNLGTGWGDEQTFKTVDVKFQKRDPDFPDAVIALYYDSAKGLEKRGVIRKYSKINPDPFPGYVTTTAGCKPPPGKFSRIGLSNKY